MILRVYLEPPMLASARAGTFNFLNVLKASVEGAGWRVEWHKTGDEARHHAPERDGYALFHAEVPTHDRALTFRRAYHYPFWQIETDQRRWRFAVARAEFDPDTLDKSEARRFAQALRNRVLPGPAPTSSGPILIPLQGQIRQCRSFQTMSPVEMVQTVAQTGKPCIATLHPKERTTAADHAALAALAARHRNLTIGGNTMGLLRDCTHVATQNSAVAFDGYLLGKPAVLFGQSDFHHIALNVADLGAREALKKAETHHPDFDLYLHWFLQQQAINATRPEAGARILAAMRRGGWPI